MSRELGTRKREENEHRENLYIMPTIVGAIFVLATADVLADAPASVQFICVGCEAASNSFGYSTYAGQRALVTVSGTAEIGRHDRHQRRTSKE
jgi:hypothetical protein